MLDDVIKRDGILDDSGDVRVDSAKTAPSMVARTSNGECIGPRGAPNHAPGVTIHYRPTHKPSKKRLSQTR